MKKSLLLVAGVLALSASLASAAGLNFAWSGCGDAGVPNATFACNSNTGAGFVATGSFVAPAGVAILTGNDVVIDLQSASATLPAWWQLFNTGACRQASLSMNWVIPTANNNCIDYWGGNAGGGLTSYRTSSTLNPTPSPNRARITGSYGVAEQFQGPIDVDAEYFAFNIVINRAKTIGSAPCAGCADPVCLVLNSINLTQPVGMGDVKISNAAANQYITWQGGAVPGGCPGTVPTQNKTWGQVKSLYR